MSNETTHRENEKELQSLLKQEFPPLQNTELRRDLWPQMLGRLDAQPFRVPWFDWALAGGVALVAVAFPAAVPVLLYYL